MEAQDALILCKDPWLLGEGDAWEGAHTPVIKPLPTLL